MNSFVDNLSCVWFTTCHSLTDQALPLFHHRLLERLLYSDSFLVVHPCLHAEGYRAYYDLPSRSSPDQWKQVQLQVSKSQLWKWPISISASKSVSWVPLSVKPTWFCHNLSDPVVLLLSELKYFPSSAAVSCHFSVRLMPVKTITFFIFLLSSNLLYSLAVRSA